MVKRPFQYGGQAVIEGVMMRGPHHIAIAVRKPTDEIVVHSEPIGSYTQKYPMLKLPFIRGIVALAEAFSLGLRSLQYSANQAIDSEGEEKLSAWEMTMTVTMAIGVTILFFVVLPLLVRNWLTQGWPIILQNLLEGVIRAVILVVYILSISWVKDIRRVFAYHGAEHKVIHTYEAKEELTVENAREKSPLHPRCGTSFLLFVIIVSTLIFSFLGKQTLLLRFVSRIALLPVVAGISYELIKFSSLHQDFILWRWLTKPGLWLQKLTTREPNDAQLEVAITSLKEVLSLESDTNEKPAEGVA
jgi:uncharacterized protein YqhQ